MLKTFGTGYKKVNIKHQPFLVHKLVMTAFRGNYDPKLVVNHKLDNLELVTASENSIHAVMTCHKSTKPVQQLSIDGSVIATYSSIKQASYVTDVIHTSIGKAANGKQKTADGSSGNLSN